MSSSYRVSNSQINPNKVFILQRSELEKRLDPQFYKQEFKDNLVKLKRSNHKRLGDLVKFSSETWNQKDYFENSFPYIEISEIDIISGEIQNIVQIEKKNAASRAKMVVRENDIIISTTRPSRGAIARIKKEQDFSIASTGFSIIRDITNEEVNREYLFTVLRQKITLIQLEQRSSGGNYPAITQQELSNVIIPLPDLKTQNKIVSVFADCFEQKQQNDAEAEKLLDSIDDYLLKELEITLPETPENTLKNRMFVTKRSELSGGRFDSEYYYPEFLNKIDIIKNLENVIQIKKIHSFICTGFNNETRFVEDGTKFLRTQNIRPVELDIENTLFTKDENIRITSIGDLLFTRIGVGVGDVSYNDKGDFAISDNIICLKLKDREIGKYIALFLNTELGKVLLIREKRDTVRAIISYENILNLPIPLPPLKKQKEIADHITAIRQQAQQLKDKTKVALAMAGKQIENILLN